MNQTELRYRRTLGSWTLQQVRVPLRAITSVINFTESELVPRVMELELSQPPHHVLIPASGARAAEVNWLARHIRNAAAIAGPEEPVPEVPDALRAVRSGAQRETP